MGWEADSSWQWQFRKQRLAAVPWSLLHILLVGSFSWWPLWPLLPEVIRELVAQLSFASILTLFSLQSGTWKTTPPWHLLPLASRPVLWTFVCPICSLSFPSPADPLHPHSHFLPLPHPPILSPLPHIPPPSILHCLETKLSIPLLSNTITAILALSALRWPLPSIDTHHQMFLSQPTLTVLKT